MVQVKDLTEITVRDLWRGVKEVYSSSRLVTLCLLSLVVPLSDELVGGEVTQGLVRPHGVVGVLPGQEFPVQGGHLQ